MRPIKDAPANEIVQAFWPGVTATAMRHEQDGMAPIWRFAGGARDGQMAPWPEGWMPVEDESEATP